MKTVFPKRRAPAKADASRDDSLAWIAEITERQEKAKREETVIELWQIV